VIGQLTRRRLAGATLRKKSREPAMYIKFFTLTDPINKPALQIWRTPGNSGWASLCDAIVEHFDGDARCDATDLVDLVEMMTPDEQEYVEAIVYAGAIVGSVGHPFTHPVTDYERT